MGKFKEYPLLPGAEWNGFAAGAITPLEAGRDSGALVLQGPGGDRAGLQWELADGPFIGRIEAPNQQHWGVYRVGFTSNPTTVDELLQNLLPLLPKFQILYQRSRHH